MKYKILTRLVLLAILTGLAACRENTPPTTAVVVTEKATPIVVTVVATAQATPTTIPTEPDPTAVPIEVEEIRFQSDHFTVVGTLQMPTAEGKRPAIIMVHGDGGINRGEFTLPNIWI